ncbi:MAG: hypothetical protein V1809_09130 [Planctomycetota bacterium]
MAKSKESTVMVELEEMRARHAKETEGLSLKELARHYREEGEKARIALGLTRLPVVRRVSR